MTANDNDHRGLLPAVLAGLLACLSCAAAIAGSPIRTEESFVPARGMRFALDLDTKEGNFSSWVPRDLSGLTALRTQLSLVRIQDHPRFLPACWFTFKDQANHYLIQLMLFAPDRQAGLRLSIDDYKDDKRAGSRDLGVDGKVGAKYQLTLSWATPGRLDLSIDGKAMPAIPLPSAVAQVELGGSTAECTFDPVELGNIGR